MESEESSLHDSDEEFKLKGSDSKRLSFPKVLVLIATMLVIVASVWSWMIVSYETMPTTQNRLAISDSNSSLSNSTNDSLIDLVFESGNDVLGWDQTSISVENEGSVYSCSVTGQTTTEQNNTKIRTQLNADGNTFSMEVDANEEETFVKLDLSMMQEATNDEFDLRFSKTDIYLGENSKLLLIEDATFDEVKEVPNGTFTSNDERLDWYDYDLSVHRVVPKNQVYLVDNGNITFKFQLISYYSDSDEARYIQIVASRLSGEPLPALDNPSLIAISPCIIVNAGDNWGPGQIIVIKENGVDICNQICNLVVDVNFQGVKVKGESRVEVL